MADRRRPTHCKDCGVALTSETKHVSRTRTYADGTPWYHSRCVDCYRAHARAKARDYRRRHPGRSAAAPRAYRDRRWRQVLDHLGLEAWICSRCGATGLPRACFDFHHRNPAGKSRRIAEMIQGAPMEEVLAEVDKCDLLCATCHRLTHWEWTHGRWEPGSEEAA